MIVKQLSCSAEPWILYVSLNYIAIPMFNVYNKESDPRE